MTADEIQAIEAYLDDLLRNHPVKAEDCPPALQGIQDRMVRLSSQLDALQKFATRLCKGDVNATPPPRDNYIAAGLKQLQSQLVHLTWQAQLVATGDYMQHVDFMGDFSHAFNEMVTQLQTREANLKDAQAVMERIFNLVEPIIVVRDGEQPEVLYANEMAESRLAAKAGPGLPERGTMLSQVMALDLRDMEQEILDRNSAKWYGVTVHKLAWGDTVGARLFYCRDITTHKMRENTLDIVAHTDDLTGISNRRAFDQRYATLWNTCLSAEKPISIILFDLDYFKQINDTYGHLNGDKMLAEFAGILKHSIARRDDMVARYGGEEFIAAMAFTNAEGALRIAKKVCMLTEKHKMRIADDQGAEVDVGVTVSAGVSSVVPAGTQHPSQLVFAADHALYQAKQSGRNRVMFEDIAAHQPIAHMQSFSKSLRGV